MKRCSALLLFIASASWSSPSLADDKGWETASSVTRDALVVAAFGVPVVQGDWTGAKQAAFSTGAALAISQALKETIHETRPDGSDAKSFPSGHTAVSFAAAATLQKRYGWQVGLPAHLAAAFVGLARVESDKHFVHDVLAGAAIGEASGLLLTSAKDAQVQFVPWGSAHSVGATVAMRF